MLSPMAAAKPSGAGFYCVCNRVRFVPFAEREMRGWETGRPAYEGDFNADVSIGVKFASSSAG